MSRRSFRPEVPADLEQRLALSGVAAVRKPVGLSSIGYTNNQATIAGYFEQYALGGDFKLLKTQVAAAEASVPFGRVDGLGEKTRVVLARMRADQADGVSGAIRTGGRRVMAAIKAEVQARVADGSVRFFE